MNIVRSQTLLSFGTCFILAQVLQIYKVNVVLGASGAVLSASLIPLMLSGLYAGTRGASFLILGRKLVNLVMFGVTSLSLATLSLPTLVASWYLASGHWLLGLGVPVVAAALFLAHPAGSAASFYALFWIIPFVLHFVAHRNLFAKMVTSVFLAHAVGTVVWLSISPLTPAAYWSLMPVVVIERTVLALGMLLAHYAITALVSFASNRNPVAPSVAQKA